MSVLTGPTRRLVDTVAWFPEAFRPGIFALVLVAAFWALTTRGRLLWDAVCRVVAILVDLGVGILLLPDYVLTSARRRSGRAPGPSTRVAGDVFERLLDGAAGLYARHGGSASPQSDPHPSPPGPRAQTLTARHREPNRPFPWRLAAIVVLVPVAAWVIHDQAPSSAAAEWVQHAWSYWSDLEHWAGD